MSAKTGEIKCFKEFLEEILGHNVLEYSLKPVTKPGDNYGAELQAVDAVIVKSNNSDEVNYIKLLK